MRERHSRIQPYVHRYESDNTLFNWYNSIVPIFGSTLRSVLENGNLRHSCDINFNPHFPHYRVAPR